ncbi:hypothetical protein DFH08DRAFT_808354 [Mycena albidolilacea]|uniref:Uncharacterized protein n=1 Tax=Mycena albidolilacea TaxID=1033008 RepID=A0AAD7ERY6_9AGAR|nr:hypothetical protein DFH08DRAFT_808354 [Mycena albidolilacea]
MYIPRKVAVLEEGKGEYGLGPEKAAQRAAHFGSRVALTCVPVSSWYWAGVGDQLSGNGGGMLIGYMTHVPDPWDPSDRKTRDTLEFAKFKISESLGSSSRVSSCARGTCVSMCTPSEKIRAAELRSVASPPTSLPSSWRPSQAPDPRQSRTSHSVPSPTPALHPAPFPTQIPPLSQNCWPSFRNDYTGHIRVNGRFNPLIGVLGWNPNSAAAVEPQPCQDGIKCQIEEYACSGRGAGTAWYDTHLTTILKIPLRATELRESGLQQGCKTRVHYGVWVLQEYFCITFWVLQVPGAGGPCRCVHRRVTPSGSDGGDAADSAKIGFLYNLLSRSVTCLGHEPYATVRPVRRAGVNQVERNGSRMYLLLDGIILVPSKVDN